MPNIIRIRRLEKETNLSGVTFPIDKQEYSENAKRVDISDLREYILSGYTASSTGGTSGTSGVNGIPGLDGADGTNGTSGVSPCVTLPSNTITIQIISGTTTSTTSTSTTTAPPTSTSTSTTTVPPTSTSTSTTSTTTAAPTSTSTSTTTAAPTSTSTSTTTAAPTSTTTSTSTSTTTSTSTSTSSTSTSTTTCATTLVEMVTLNESYISGTDFQIDVTYGTPISVFKLEFIYSPPPTYSSWYVGDTETGTYSGSMSMNIDVSAYEEGIYRFTLRSYCNATTYVDDVYFNRNLIIPTSTTTSTSTSSTSTSTTTAAIPTLNSVMGNHSGIYVELSGTSVSNNGSDITETGIVVAINPTIPTVDTFYAKKIVCTGTCNDSVFSGSFISELSSSTNYNIRAYATNGTGTGYGNTINFSTT